MSSISRAVIALQGAVLLLNSIATLFLHNEVTKPGATFEGTPTGVLYVISTSSMTLGIFHIVAAFQPQYVLRQFLLASIPPRISAVAIFLGGGVWWRNVAIWEGAMGVLSAMLWMLRL